MVDWHKAFTGRPDPNIPTRSDPLLPLSSILALHTLRFLFTTKLGWLVIALAVAGGMLNEFNVWLKQFPPGTVDNVIAISILVGICVIIWIHRDSIARTYTIPNEGPLLIKVRENLRPGLRYACRLIIDVRFPHNDWKRIQDYGLTDVALFQYSKKKYAIKEEMLDFTIGELGRKTYVGFFSTQQMHAAKAKLIEGLHGLKGHIEQLKDGPHEEVIEL